jgi:endoglucanase
MKMHHRKTILAALAAVAWLMVVTTPAAADTEVTHGVTSAQQSPAEWWDLPYPQRFDADLLAAEQPRIRVEGKDFVTRDGQTFVFRGVNIADPDKLEFQGHWNRGLFEEIARWGANAIRLPVHPIAWRNRGPDWFLARIDEAVFWSNALGMYLIIDWHSIGNLETAMFQHPMYQTDVVETTDFWRRIAFRYRDVPTVAVYELFNEPTDNFIGIGSGSLGKLDWASWRETMETMIDIVQVYNPAAITLVGGMNWAYNLKPVADAPIRRDNVAYAAHAYPQKARPSENTREGWFTAWERDWGFVADSHPVIATEIGWVREDGFNPHVPVIDNSGAYGPNLVRYMERKGVSWTVWNFDPDWSPTMIADWDFTPTEQGRFFRDVMLRARADTLAEAVLPSPRVVEYPWMSIERWRDMFAEDLSIAARGDVGLLFLGDSITEMWPGDIWQEHFGRYRPANFGIGGDKTQNLLWRLRNGAVGALDPEVVVLMIGVNNFGLGRDGPEDVFLGVEAVVDEVARAFGNAEILLLGILPYGQQPGTPERRQVTEANRLIAGLDAHDRVHFHDIGAAFLQADGSISPEVMADFLHPTEKGYLIFAEQLDGLLAGLFD